MGPCSLIAILCRGVSPSRRQRVTPFTLSGFSPILSHTCKVGSTLGRIGAMGNRRRCSWQSTRLSVPTLRLDNRCLVCMRMQGTGLRWDTMPSSPSMSEPSKRPGHTCSRSQRTQSRLWTWFRAPPFVLLMTWSLAHASGALRLHRHRGERAPHPRKRLSFSNLSLLDRSPVHRCCLTPGVRGVSARTPVCTRGCPCGGDLGRQAEEPGALGHHCLGQHHAYA